MRRFFLYVIPVCLSVFISIDSLSAQCIEDTSTIVLKVTRPAFEPVQSLVVKPSVGALDTLDTVNENVKVVLYSDNTWQYYKTPDFRQDGDVFTKNWNANVPDSYRIPLTSMPSSWSIWLVDSLSQYCCPYRGKVYPGGKFGPRRGREHRGVDIPLRTGTPIYAPFNGKVRVSRVVNGYGNLVVIRHDNGIETFYGHLSQRNVEAGDWVKAGDIIGLGGSTGRSSGPHLHLETRYNGYAFDPQWLFDFDTGDLRHRLFVLKKSYFNIRSSYGQNFEDEIKNEEEDKKEKQEREAMKWYTIKSGDTLGAIAIANNTSVSKICSMNGITPTTILQIGARIRVR